MAEYQSAIDWLWTHHESPAQLECVLDVVNFSPEEVSKQDLADTLVLRGNKTANECVVEAIRSARAGDRSTALRWLMAGQCHNPAGHRKDIKEAGDDAVTYALERYGNEVP